VPTVLRILRYQESSIYLGFGSKALGGENSARQLYFDYCLVPFGQKQWDDSLEGCEARKAVQFARVYPWLHPDSHSVHQVLGRLA
jgi:hypothetical protein